ncbi:MAG: NUDIX domain-containing protein [Oscillospiraceae bacterium]|nr:NUDIX domain-containing protein [Candidatus Equicaccousia limihippi]
MELWDVYDGNGKPTGKIVPRGVRTLKNGEYHLVVHIWPISKDGALLIQRRSHKKRMMPGIWAATGGSAIAGENSLTAAKRELFEELGITSQLEFIKRMRKRNSFVDIYATRVRATVDSLKLQKSEVASAKWVSIQTLENMVECGEFHNYGENYFSHIFDFAKKVKDEKTVLSAQGENI